MKGNVLAHSSRSWKVRDRQACNRQGPSCCVILRQPGGRAREKETERKEAQMAFL